MTLDAQTYRCDCEEGFRGALCNLQGEPAGLCQSLQCLHGQCEEADDGEHCICEQGYTGESCDIGEEDTRDKGVFVLSLHYMLNPHQS